MARADEDSDSDDSISSPLPSPIPDRSPRSPLTPRSTPPKIKKKLSKKLSKRILAEQKNLSLLSVTWQKRVGAGNWESYSSQNSKSLTDHYCRGVVGRWQAVIQSNHNRNKRSPEHLAPQITVDLGRFNVDLRLMNQTAKDEDGDEFSQVRALNHRGKPLPRLQKLTIQAMHEEKQRVDEQIFPPCVFKLVFVYASYQVGRLAEHSQLRIFVCIVSVRNHFACEFAVGHRHKASKTLLHINNCCRVIVITVAVVVIAHVRGRRQARQATK